MATKAHCAFCFETLSASFERRKPLSLAKVESLWEAYQTNSRLGRVVDGDEEEADGTDGEGEEDVSELDDDTEMTDVEGEPESAARTTDGRPAAISKLLNRVSGRSPSSSGSSASSSPSTQSTMSSGTATPASSQSSASRSAGSGKTAEVQTSFPLFVTWNTVSRSSGHKSLRGCIGTFEPLELEHGLRSYALTSAFEDVRFNPIPASLLPSLSAHVTLLTNFTSPTRDPLAWTLGRHGIRISFAANGRRLGATYLPDVPPEQGWTKEETLISLMRKAGWSGSSANWERAWQDGRGELVTYEGKQVGMAYAEWQAWRDYVEKTEARK